MVNRACHVMRNVVRGYVLGHRMFLTYYCPLSQPGSRRASSGASAALSPGVPLSPTMNGLVSARPMPDAVRIDVRKTGYLTKLGGKNKNWKRRWFVLDTEKLAYYKRSKVRW
eukprot:Opistho-1_new@93792